MTTRLTLSDTRVLVVEDDTDSRNAMTETLAAAGASVTAAATAGDALAALAAQRFDVVVSDLAMPQQSGFWLITKVRQLYPDHPIPVLAVTGHPFPADGVRRAGFDDVLQKPPDPDVLVARVAGLAGVRNGARS